MAIVGPNGCGKTNLVDAVRWVLGEQRTSLLRTERMEAVIFNGSVHRKPAGYAEVTITLLNEDGEAPLPYAEIAITRRLYRTGESEYLINKNPSRLRDIQKLLTEVGMGRQTYSIIEISMIENILYGSREARRGLLEDAAGISYYRSRIAEAQKRLENSRLQLQRLEDVYQEIERQYLTLKRQASRAERARSLQKILNLRLQWELGKARLEMEKKRKEVDAELNSLRRELKAREESIMHLMERLQESEQREDELARQLDQLYKELTRWERSRSECEKELALARQRLSQINRQLEEKSREREMIGRRHEEDHHKLEQFLKERDQQDAAVKSLNLHFLQLEARYREKAGEVQMLKSQLEERRRKLVISQQEYQRQQREAYRRQIEMEQALREAENITANLDDLQSQIGKCEAERGELNEAVNPLKEEVVRKKGIVKRLAEEIEHLKQEHRDLSHQMGEVVLKQEMTLGQLQAHLQSLYYNFPTSFASTVQQGGYTLVKEMWQVPEPYQRAVLAVTRYWLEAVVVPDLEEGFNLLSEIAQEGRVLLYHQSHRPIEAGLIPQPPVKDARLLSELLDKEEGVSPTLTALTNRVILVPDEESLWKAIEWANIYHFLLVTPTGTLYRPEGLLEFGSLDKLFSLTQWKEKEKALKAEKESLEARIAELTSLTKMKEEILSQSEKERQEVEEKIKREEEQLRHIEFKIANLQELEKRLIRQRESLSHQLEEIHRKISRLEENPQTPTLLLSPEEWDSWEEEIARLEQKVRSGESELAEILQEKTKIHEEVVTIRERIASLSAQIQNLQSITTDFIAQSQRLHNETLNLERESFQTGDALGALETQLKMVEEEEAKLLAHREVLERERQANAFSRETLSNELKEAQAEVRKLSEHLTLKEREEASLSERLREVDRRLVEEIGVLPGTISQESLMGIEEELKQLPSGELTAEQVRSRLNSLGPVNMAALEELEEVEERYRFITEQRKDLKEGISLLEETIERTSRYARLRLRSTFEQVNLGFQQLFQTLFEGGEARLTMVGDDPLSADIQIWATPSGKRLQNLSALSGGEKALTAIALLFAIYQTRPTPFCILDEIDAPLDDANVQRFTRLLRQFTEHTQFLIVTHNKQTMEAADCLFGVSLGEDGTSQLVSVKLNQEGKPVSEKEGAVS